jgi:hypothetical protein
MQCHQYEYDPLAVQPHQAYDWDCSAAATAWMGRATGWGWQETDVAFEFVRAGIATPRLGLLDGTGVGIVRWLADQPYPATNQRAQYQDVIDLVVGGCPCIIGSSAWYHWSGVRAVSDSGLLLLANSAPGWAGIWQSMDRTRFDTFGDFYAVFPQP